MIKESMPLTLAEVAGLAGESDKEEKLKAFIKKFNKISEKDAKEMKAELVKLDLIKLKETDIVKIIDFMPQDSSDLIKVAPNASLDQDEINKILEVVKKYQ